MKYVFFILVAIGLIAVGYFIRLNIEPEPEYVEVQIENPVNKTLYAKAVLYEDSLSLYRKIIERLKDKEPEVIVEYKVKTEKEIVKEVDTVHVSVKDEMIAEAHVEFDNYKATMKYFYKPRVFQFDYEKQYDIYKTVKKPSFRIGLYGTYFADSRVAVGLVFGFPRIFSPLYLTIGADSEKHLSAGLQIILNGG